MHDLETRKHVNKRRSEVLIDLSINFSDYKGGLHCYTID